MISIHGVKSQGSSRRLCLCQQLAEIVVNTCHLEVRLTLEGPANIDGLLSSVAVHFHNEPLFVTVEVHKPVTDLMLAAEFQLGQLAVANKFPQQIFGRRLLLSQFARPFNEAGEVKAAPIMRCLAPFSPWEKGWG